MAFLVAIFLVAFLTTKGRLSPFLSLVVSALAYGVMTGMGPELMGAISEGLVRVFSALAIMVLSGSVITPSISARSGGGADRRRHPRGRRRGAGAPGGGAIRIPGRPAGDVHHDLLSILEPVVGGMGRRARVEEEVFYSQPQPSR